MTQITVIILTFNEERNIERCLEFLSSFTDDITIVDSYSTDKTLEISERFGCRIYQNKFINQANQFNWALDNVDFKYDWILRLDADEVLPDRLKEEIKSRVGKEEEVYGYYLNRRMYWMNRWLKHGRMYPHYILRIFKNGHARYELKTEEHLIVKGKTAYLKNDFLENNNNNSLEYFTEKHLKTASGEVDEIFNPTNVNDYIEAKLFGSKVERTRWLKERVYSRTPLFIRPFLYFIYRYFFCLGFLDGKEGLIFHVLQGFWYRFYIDAKLYEIRSGCKETRVNHRNI